MDKYNDKQSNFFNADEDSIAKRKQQIGQYVIPLME